MCWPVRVHVHVYRILSQALPSANAACSSMKGACTSYTHTSQDQVVLVNVNIDVMCTQSHTHPPMDCETWTTIDRQPS